jgi:tryprostatin B 6-hydroxylase
MEMKDFICHVVKNFESVRFAPGEDGEALAKLTKDHFTLGVKPMELIFEERKGS